MATKSEIERLAVVENKVDTIIDEVRSINSKLDNLDEKFAAKWVQTIVGGLVTVVLLGFIGVVVAFFIPHKTNTTTGPSSSTTTTTNTPTGSTSATRTTGSRGTVGGPNATANAKADAAKPADSQSSNGSDGGNVQVTLPKVP